MPRSFADKLNQLFETVRRDDGSAYSLNDVASAVNAEGRTKLSASYLSELRTGRKDNPNVWVADALARFFGQPLEYFVDDDLAPTARTRGKPPHRAAVEADLSTFAGRLAVLVAATQPAGGRAPDSRQLARALTSEGTKVTASELDAVRTGTRKPDASLVGALAEHFGAPEAFLLNQEVAESLAGDLRLLRAMRDQGLRRLAFRANRLSAEDRKTVADLINRLSGETGMSPDELDF